jgi:hypothetical protein
MAKVATDVYIPRYKINGDTVEFESGMDVVATVDREDDSIVILDFGGDIGEVYFKRAQLERALRVLEMANYSYGEDLE